MKNILLLLLVLLLFSGCSCDTKIVKIKIKKIDRSFLNKVTKIEYRYYSPSYNPKYRRNSVLSITRNKINKKIYIGARNTLYSEGSMKIELKQFESLKLSVLKNHIGICKSKRVDCLSNVEPIEEEVGCFTEVLAFYQANKKLFSEYVSCNQGRLCGNYEKVISDIKKLTQNIQIKKVDRIKLIKYENL